MKKLILIIASVVIVSSTHLILSSTSEQTRKRPHSTISSTGSSTTSPQNAHVQAFFTPQDDVEAKLLSFLNQARRTVLMAMYWITNDRIIDKLIELKRRGRDVKVIIDESSPDILEVSRILLSGDIIPLIYPSKTFKMLSNIGIMHDKFVVVDNDDVFTGSANFTKQGLTNSDVANYENILILKANGIARNYKVSFFNIHSETRKTYIYLLANLARDEMPDWFSLLLTKLPKESLNRAFEDNRNEFDENQQASVMQFLSTQTRQISGPSSSTSRGIRRQERDQSSFRSSSTDRRSISPVERPTIKQEKFLRARNINIAKMSKNEATERIRILIGQEQDEHSGSFVNEWDNEYEGDDDEWDNEYEQDDNDWNDDDL